MFQDEYFSNRANIFLAMEKWEEAEQDANKALELGKDNGKEFDRRAQARVGLKRYKSALADFKKAKELDPKTKNVDKNITETEKKMADAEAAEKKAEEEKVEEKATDEISKDPEEGKTEATADKADEAEEAKEESKESKEESAASDDKEKTDEELLLEIEARKAELERRLQAKVEAEAEEEMKEMIRERVLQKERKRLEKEKEAFRKMVKRFEEEERRRNGEVVVSDDERKDSGLGSYSDHAEVFLETKIHT